MSFSFCLIETRSKDWTDVHQKMIKNQYIFNMQFICSFYVFFSFNAVNKLHVVLSKPPEKTHVVLETVFNLHRNCIQVFTKFLSETRHMLFLIHFGQGFGKKKRHKVLDTMENLDTYIQAFIH